jgi:hypothetical protein
MRDRRPGVVVGLIGGGVMIVGLGPYLKKRWGPIWKGDEVNTSPSHEIFNSSLQHLIMRSYRWSFTWSYRWSYMLRNVCSSYIPSKKFLRQKFISNVMLCEVIILVPRMPHWLNNCTKGKDWLCEICEILSRKRGTEFFELNNCYNSYRSQISSKY